MIMDPLLTTKQASLAYGVTRRTIRRAIKNGHLKAFKLKKQFHIFESTLIERYGPKKEKPNDTRRNDKDI